MISLKKADGSLLSDAAEWFSILKIESETSLENRAMMDCVNKDS